MEGSSVLLLSPFVIHITPLFCLDRCASRGGGKMGGTNSLGGSSMHRVRISTVYVYCTHEGVDLRLGYCLGLGLWPFAFWCVCINLGIC